MRAERPSEVIGVDQIGDRRRGAAPARRRRWPWIALLLVPLFAGGCSCVGPDAPGHATGADARADASVPDASTIELFGLVCAHCHSGPALGAPRIGHPEEWNAREARDLETLLARTIDGHGDMPPLGTCAFCSERQLRHLIALMVAGSDVDLTPSRPTR